MRVVGLTGGIACGKSLVSSWLREQEDCRVIDGDLLSRELTAPGGAALPDLRIRFGAEVFTADGRLNRRALGSLVFSDPEARADLDRLMAPFLRDLTLQRLSEARAEGIALCFLDYPLLFEKGYDALCDTVWCVTLPPALQLQRLMSRDHLTEPEARLRMEAVLSTKEKAARSQVLIDNSGDRAFTLSLLPPLLEEERRQAGIREERRRRSDRYSAGSSLPEMLLPPSVPVTGAPSAPVLSRSQPESMERPAASRRKAEPKKAPWRLPVWLSVLLAVAFFLVLGTFTAQALMQAWLTRKADQHLAEERAIHTHYPLEYREMIESAAEEYNLQPAFVSAIIRCESSFQPLAESSVGARGLMQLMPDTAEWIAGKMRFPDYAFERMYDPESNVRFGCWYLRYLASLFHGDPVCVACAYHAGQGQVTAWLSDSRYSDDGTTLVLSRLAEGPTKTYAGRVIRTYGIYQALYFESPVPADGADAASLDAGFRQ